MIAGVGERERVRRGLGEGARSGGFGCGEGHRDDFADELAEGGRRTWSGGGQRRVCGNTYVFDLLSSKRATYGFSCNGGSDRDDRHGVDRRRCANWASGIALVRYSGGRIFRRNAWRWRTRRQGLLHELCQGWNTLWLRINRRLLLHFGFRRRFVRLHRLRRCSESRRGRGTCLNLRSRSRCMRMPRRRLRSS